jgi:hypothetical protein
MVMVRGDCLLTYSYVWFVYFAWRLVCSWPLSTAQYLTVTTHLGCSFHVSYAHAFLFICHMLVLLSFSSAIICTLVTIIIIMVLVSMRLFALGGHDPFHAPTLLDTL